MAMAERTVKIYPQVWSKVVLDLLALADHPDQVATDTDNGFGLRVPYSLYEKWLMFNALEEGESAPDAGNAAYSSEAIPTPKKRGRPRKNPLPVEEG